MSIKSPFTADELLSLAAIQGMILGAKPLPAAHLARLLRRKFIAADGDRYRATPVGLFQVAHNVWRG